MGESFEQYSEEELEKLVEHTARRIRQRWEREGRKDFEKYEAGLRKDLLEMYKRFNVVFGKQRTESSYSV
jgi:hypothetical protein